MLLPEQVAARGHRQPRGPPGRARRAARVRAAAARGAAISDAQLDEAADAADADIALVARAEGGGGRAGGHAAAALRAELSAMRSSAVRARAVAAGASEAKLSDADDADDSQAVFIELILARDSTAAPGSAGGAGGRRGLSEQILTKLQAGGEQAADALSSILDLAIEMLEQRAAASPRKSRKAVRDLVDSAEALAESIDAEWCDGVSLCSVEDLLALSDSLAALNGISTATASMEVSSLVTAVLEQLRRCGSAVV